MPAGHWPWHKANNSIRRRMRVAQRWRTLPWRLLAPKFQVIHRLIRRTPLWLLERRRAVRPLMALQTRLLQLYLVKVTESRRLRSAVLHWLFRVQRLSSLKATRQRWLGTWALRHLTKVSVKPTSGMMMLVEPISWLNLREKAWWVWGNDCEHY